MRVTPTPEQMAYLASIGVSDDSAKPSSPRSSPPGKGHPSSRHVPARRGGPSSGGAPARRSLRWWAVVLAVLALLLSFAVLANAQEAPRPWGNPPPSGALTDRQDDPGPVQPPDTSAAEGGGGVSVAPERAASVDQITPREGEILPFYRPMVSLWEPLPPERLTPRETLHRDMEAIRADIADIRTDLAAIEMSQPERTDGTGELTASMAPATDVRAEDVRLASERRAEARTDDLFDALGAHRRALRRLWVWLIVIGAVAIAVLTTNRMAVERRLHRAEQLVMSGLSEKAAAISNGPATPEPATRSTPDPQARTEARVPIAPARPPLQIPPDSTRQMQSIIACANRFYHIREKPRLPSGTWDLGLATHKGHVRSDNQDYGLGFHIGGHDVLVVADGCGGIPHGQRAAYLAVVTAAVSIVRTYGMASRWNVPHVRGAAERAIMDAAHRLAIEGDKLGVHDIRDGLRTTLIVVIANDDHEVGYAYIGDGGGYVVKTIGEAHRFLVPHKASGFAANVLAASLGPRMEGEPATGVFRRSPGDLLLVGTDGIFDRTEEATFGKDVLRGCLQHAGDLQGAADQIVEELACFQDANGYICDDNMTLGIMGDGTAPSTDVPPSGIEESESQPDTVPPRPGVFVKEEAS